MTKAIRIHQHGGPDCMRWEEVELADPGPGQLRLKQHAVGLNFIDVYHRTGLYPVGPLPAIIGMEGAGEVTALGAGVTEFKVGDQVAYAMAPMGSYAEERLYPADRLVKLPGGIDTKKAAAMMLQGMTAEYLIRRTYPVKAGETILVHAAAGGVGLILCQWAKHIGATVIGTVGSEAKAELARAHGCDHPIVYAREDFQKRTRELSSGKGVSVVYDGIGKDTFDGSLDCLAPRGMMVSFGNASGPVPPFELLKLSQKGSLFITRPSLAAYTSTRAELLESSSALFDLVQKGAVKIEINQTYALKDAAIAHRDLEARKTTGSTVLLT
ncbi:MAG: quinone oxidoreductase [Alphaproteobacteria bacterium]|nr:quinone oxidoreductase [Alphaproteobacteria bacterium]